MEVVIKARIAIKDDEEIDLVVQGDYAPFGGPSEAYIKMRDDIIKSREHKEEK